MPGNFDPQRITNCQSLSLSIEPTGTGSGQTYTAVSKTLQATILTLSTWAALYKEKGLKALEDKPGSGHPIEIDGEQRAKIKALASSDPPEGYARWSLRLLADRVVELGYFEHISHTEVAEILKKMN